MRRVVLVLIVLSALMGCSKGSSLVGETYAAYGYHSDEFNAGYIHIDGYDAYYVFRFIDRSTAERTTRQHSPQGSIIGDIESCTYTLKYPSIEISYYNSALRQVVTEKGKFLDKKTFRIGKYDYVKQ